MFTNYKALLFDFDGVIAETMPFHLAAWRETLLEYGAHLDDRMVLENEGRQALDIASRILKHAGVEVDYKDIQEIVDQKNKLFRSTQQAGIYPEIPHIFSSAKRHGVQIALVTGTLDKNVRSVVSPEIYAQFEAVIDGRAVAQGKPAPDPYLRAAENLGVRAAECIVIENAPMGILSAKAAGMFCIAVCTTLTGEQLKEADVKVLNHEELKAFLEQSVFNSGH
ncbi:MAG: HAD-IA family hydrolase [candidate division KSB1 bacterium]|nr:HAD-IA family hydrolase [candidate division KSB1 bacterium]